MGAAEEYASFLLNTRYPFCWWCGRQNGEAVDGWNSHLIIERAHIVSRPRVEDRRVVMLLCSRCHAAQTNSVFRYELPICGLSNMLWLKKVFDSDYFDKEFLGRYCLGRLPKARVPAAIVQQEFLSRMGDYPDAV